MSITIKQAFQKLAMVTGAAVKNPWFVIRNLNQAFADIADNVVDASGDKVTVTQTLTEGTQIGSIKVNNDTTVLYAPASSVETYSTEERLIGVWVDGTPLYQKTFVYDTAQNYGSVVFSTGLTDVDEVVSFEGVASYSSSGVNAKWLPFVFSNDSNGTGTSNAILKINSFLKTTGDIYAYIGADYQGDSSINRVRVTLKYTKNAT